MLSTLIAPNLYNYVISKVPETQITEIRLRLGKKLCLKTAERTILTNYAVCESDLEKVIKTATRNSLYAFQDEIKDGFISYGGIRIGIAGKGVRV